MPANDSQVDLRIKAAKIASSAHLQDLRLTSSNVELYFAPEYGCALDLDMKIELSGKPADENNVVVVQADFDLTISLLPEIEDASDEFNAVAHLKFGYVAAFEFENAVEHDEESLEAFARTTGVFAIYPYAREYVTDITTRLGLPPLVLDLLKQR